VAVVPLLQLAPQSQQPGQDGHIADPDDEDDVDEVELDDEVVDDDVLEDDLVLDDDDVVDLLVDELLVPTLTDDDVVVVVPAGPLVDVTAVLPVERTPLDEDVVGEALCPSPPLDDAVACDAADDTLTLSTDEAPRSNAFGASPGSAAHAAKATAIAATKGVGLKVRADIGGPLQMSRTHYAVVGSGCQVA
jgi:hypothetical protein